jgi:hypothetical protein
MQAQKIILILIIVLLLVGASLFVAYLFLPASSQTSSTVPKDTLTILDGGADNNSVIPSNVQSASTTEESTGPIDIDHEYADLFAKLGGQEVVFTPSTGSTAKSAGVYALYSDDIDFEKKMQPGVKSFPVDMAFVDLNSDGADEVLVYENLDSLCGSSGCPFDIYARQGGGWQNILSTMTYEHLALLGQSGNGYKNLLIPGRGNVSFQTKINRWVWTGAAYQLFGAEAYWNGTTFLTGQ